jgi:hypothetical protein
MKNNKFLIVPIALGMVLIFAIFYSIFFSLRASDKVLHPDLLNRVPVKFPGWDVTELKIAETERIQNAVSEQLNYDHAIYRQYTAGGKTLAVYAAYWRPYKLSPRLISIHTPDVCWVVNGWEILSADYEYPITINHQPAWHAQQRLFEAGSKQVNVLFWHLLDGRLSGYAEGPQSTSKSFVGNIWRDLRQGAGEQFFIRISSDRPWSEWKDEPLFNEILNAFSPVLLAQPEA